MPRWPSPDPNSWAFKRKKKRKREARQARMATSPRVLAKREKRADEALPLLTPCNKGAHKPQHWLNPCKKGNYGEVGGKEMGVGWVWHVFCPAVNGKEQ